MKTTVSDNGIGIPKHQVPRLFTKFFRAENVAKLPVTGSGLGLFIAHNIIARHGGRIQVQSKEGTGTTFTVLIPINEAMIPAKDEIAASLYI
jgi:signal transduction histidine kinase